MCQLCKSSCSYSVSRSDEVHKGGQDAHPTITLLISRSQVEPGNERARGSISRGARYELSVTFPF